MSINSYAQQIYFSNRYDLNNASADVGKAVLCDTNQIVVVAGWTDFITYKLDLCFFDLQGTLLNKKTISAPGVSFYGGGYASLDKTYDGGYVVGGSYESGGNIDALLYRFNSAGDTLWTKQIGDSAEWQSGWQAKQTTDGGFILCGATTTFDIDGDFLLVKTDSLGNVQWQKHYGSGWADLANTVIQTNDGGYFVGGNFNNNYQMQGDGKFYKTDSLGNVQWTALYGNPLQKDRLITCLQTKDGGYLMGGTYTDSSWQSGSIPFGRLYLVKLNPNGTLQWEKKYIETRYNVAIISVRELADSSIIAAGTTSDSFPQAPIGFILKTNQYGDSLWYREYELLNATYSDNTLLDIYPMPDGGFVTCGWVVPSLPDTGTQDVWIMRVDSLGCSYPLCDPTFGMNDNVHYNKGMVVYPNPFSDNIFIKTNFSEGELEVYDVYGKKVFKAKILEKKKINLSFLASGLYIVSVKTKQAVFTTKIIKQ